MANTLNNPLTRRYYQAERHDTEWSGGINVAGFSIGLDANHQEHNYPSSSLGLRRDAATGWLLLLATPRRVRFPCPASFGEQTRKLKTAGHTEFPTRDWHYDTEDTVTTAGARFRANRFPHRAIDLAVDYAYSNGIGDYETTLEDVRSSFPSLISRHQSVDTRYGGSAILLRPSSPCAQSDPSAPM